MLKFKPAVYEQNNNTERGNYNWIFQITAKIASNI